MIPDLSPIFKEYEVLRTQADQLFDRLNSAYPQAVKCKAGCSDCCNALFDLSLVESMYINSAFQKKFKYGPERSAILEKASKIDRNLTKIKHNLYKAEKAGEPIESIIAKAGQIRMACPLLTDDGHCILYEDRPITCRLYGIPLEIGSKSHVCGLSDFAGGNSYPAVKLSRIQNKLEDLSKKIAQVCESRFDLTEVYVPLSMALLSRYDEAYLGIGKAVEED